MFSRTLHRQMAGKPIRAKTLAGLAEGQELLSKLRVGYGLVQEMVAGIMTIRVATSLASAKCLQVGSGGITAFNATTKALGFGTVRIWNVDPATMTLVDSGRDVTVYNNTLSAVPANKWGQHKWIDGFPFIDVESCT